MYFKKFLDKHFLQIKEGGIIVILKKIMSLFYLFFQLPIYLISIPTIIVITLIRPWYLIRWSELHASRIGHFTLNTELYCCERDAKINTPTQRYKDFFYLSQNICNKTLESMWHRNLLILPRWLLKPINETNNFFFGKKNIHNINSPTNVDIDVHNLLEKFDSHINFTPDEEIKGKKTLEKIGLPQNAKFICLLVRDSGYLNRHSYDKNTERWSYHNYRNGNIDNFILAAEELASRGYYVFRVGTNVMKPLNSSNPRIIDYSNSKIRSDFMDIYLGAKCFFCISAQGGFEGISATFRRPIAVVSMPLGLAFTNNQKYLHLTKHHINRLNKKELTISEIFSSKVALAYRSEDFKNNNVELQENTPEEIRDFVIEMDDRLNGNWIETDEDISLQKFFWSVFEKNMSNLDPNEKFFLNKFNTSKLHGKIKAKFSAKYLRDNKNFIN